MLLGPGARAVDTGNPVSDHPINFGLLSWYLPLASNAGGFTVYDLRNPRTPAVISGSSNNTYFNGTAPGNRIALRMDGTNDGAFTGTTASTYGLAANPATICGWVRPLDVSGGALIAVRDTSSGSPQQGWWINLFGGSNWRYKVQNSAGTNIGLLSGTAPVVGRWDFVCATSGANNDHRIYVNGRLDGTDTTSVTPAFTSQVGLGGQPPQGNGDFLNGFATDWRVYNRALSAPEVLELFNQGRRGNPDLLRTYTPATWVVISTPAGGGSQSVTAADAPSTSDVATRLLSQIRTAADSPSTTDAATRVLSNPRTAADSPSTSDTAARVTVETRTAADSPSTSDAAVRVTTQPRAAADGPSTSDAATATATKTAVAVDSPSTSDAAASAFVGARTVADSPSTSDAAVRTLSEPRTAADSPSTSDAVTRAFVGARAAADSPSTSDSVSASSGIQSRTAADSPSTSDAAVRVLSEVRAAADSPSTSDAVTRALVGTRTAADSPSTSDVVTRTATAVRTAADSPSTADALTRLLAAIRTAADAPSTSDVVEVSGVVVVVSRVGFAGGFGAAPGAAGTRTAVSAFAGGWGTALGARAASTVARAGRSLGHGTSTGGGGKLRAQAGTAQGHAANPGAGGRVNSAAAFAGGHAAATAPPAKRTGAPGTSQGHGIILGRGGQTTSWPGYAGGHAAAYTPGTARRSAPGTSQGHATGPGGAAARRAAPGTSQGHGTAATPANLVRAAPGVSPGHSVSSAFAAVLARVAGAAEGWGFATGLPAPPTPGILAQTWLAAPGGRVWIAADPGPMAIWTALAGTRTWKAGANVGALVLNSVEETIPAGGTVRLGMDFGNLPEIVPGGGVVESCTIEVSPVTVPALTYNPSSIEIDGGFLVSALFTGGAAGNYQVKFTPTLDTGQVLPPRAGLLTLKAPDS